MLSLKGYDEFVNKVKDVIKRITLFPDKGVVNVLYVLADDCCV